MNRNKIIKELYRLGFEKKFDTPDITDFLNKSCNTMVTIKRVGEEFSLSMRQFPNVSNMASKSWLTIAELELFTKFCKAKKADYKKIMADVRIYGNNV